MFLIFFFLFQVSVSFFFLFFFFIFLAVSLFQCLLLPIKLALPTKIVMDRESQYVRRIQTQHPWRKWFWNFHFASQEEDGKDTSGCETLISFTIKGLNGHAKERNSFYSLLESPKKEKFWPFNKILLRIPRNIVSVKQTGPMGWVEKISCNRSILCILPCWGGNMLIWMIFISIFLQSSFKDLLQELPLLVPDSLEGRGKVPDV